MSPMRDWHPLEQVGVARIPLDDSCLAMDVSRLELSEHSAHSMLAWEHERQLTSWHHFREWINSTPAQFLPCKMQDAAGMVLRGCPSHHVSCRSDVRLHRKALHPAAERPFYRCGKVARAGAEARQPSSHGHEPNVQQADACHEGSADSHKVSRRALAVGGWTLTVCLS